MNLFDSPNSSIRHSNLIRHSDFVIRHSLLVIGTWSFLPYSPRDASFVSAALSD